VRTAIRRDDESSGKTTEKTPAMISEDTREATERTPESKRLRSKVRK
jgi:hypothetical protein